jgi:FMN reductase (NADPH)
LIEQMHCEREKKTMKSNPIVDTMLNRKSIRRYTGDMPPDEVITTIVRAGQQAPFAYQLCSLLLSRKQDQNPFRAPLLFTICVDSHRLERVMAHRQWQMVTNDLSLLFFGIQDAALMAENMVIAAESLGLGSCFLGSTPYRAETIAGEYRLPKRVFPLVQLTMGYPAEDPPPRPRYPIQFALFEDEYPDLDDEMVRRAMAEMDQGYQAQGYYREANYIIPLESDRKETFTFDNYGWTEHISRKAGQWQPSPKALLEQLSRCGFTITLE